MALVISLNTRPEKHEDSYNFQQQNHVTEQSDTLPFEQLKCVGQKYGDALIGIFFVSVQTPIVVSGTYRSTCSASAFS